MSQIKIMLVDDHQVVRDGIRAYLDYPQYLVVDEAESGEEAIKKMAQHELDLVIIDINMGGINGIDTVVNLKKKFPQVHFIALTMHNEYHHIKAMIDAGASGYLLKSCGEEEMRQSIETVMTGNNYYSEEVMQTIMNNFGKKNAQKGPATPLTLREKEVYRLILQEYGNQEIADKLFISVRTVEVHKRNLIEKTGAKNATGLVIYAIKNKIFDDL